MGDDDIAGGFDPAAVVSDTVRGAKGADDGIPRNLCSFRAFQDEVESRTHLAGALGEEVSSTGMAIDGVARNFVARSDLGGAVPVKEFVFDGVAVGVIANEALTFVPVGSRNFRGAGRSY